MKVDIELKPCPFCGQTETLEIGTFDELNSVETEEDGFENYAVCCSANNGGCGASSGYAENKELAICKWNERRYSK